MIKLAVFSDSHLGAGLTDFSERRNDIVKGFRVFSEKIGESNPDGLIFTGDLFHEVYPRKPSHFNFAIREFTWLGEKLSDKCTVTSVHENKKVPPLFMIHGNHDGTRDPDSPAKYSSILELFEIFQIANYTDLYVTEEITEPKIFLMEDKDVKLGIQGFGYRHPNVARNLLKEFTPMDDVDYNLLLMHQTIEGLQTPTTPIQGLLQEEIVELGFDVIIDGHIHRPLDPVPKIRDTLIILPGSTERIDSGEIGEKKGYFILEFGKNGINTIFKEIDLDSEVRRLHRIRVNIADFVGREILDEAIKEVKSKLKDPLNAYVVIDLLGKVRESVSPEIRSSIANAVEKMGVAHVVIRDKTKAKTLPLLSVGESKTIEIGEDLFKKLLEEKPLKTKDKKPIRDEEIIKKLAGLTYKVFEASKSDNEEETKKLFTEDLRKIVKDLKEREEHS
ncbi:MAG: exonuclease SbcCD subunit D [Candidatus Hydrothermarchaeota archaeon]